MAVTQEPRPLREPEERFMQDKSVRASEEIKPISKGELLTLLDAENKDAVGPAESELAHRQDKALETYLGFPYGDEMEGRSQVVSRDTANAVDWCLPDLLEPFVAGNPLEFIPTKPEDEAFAAQATEYVRHILFEDNTGFQILHDVAKDGLIQKIGIAKVFWRESDDIMTDEIYDANVLSYQQLVQDPEIEITALTVESLEEKQGEMDEYDPRFYPDGKVYDVGFKRRRKVETVGVEAVPPEEFRIARRSSDIQTAYYCAQEVKLTISELVEMGFDPEMVHGLPSTDDRATERKDVRFEGEYKRIERGAPDPSQNTVTLLEEYVRADRNGDGVGELLQIFRVQNVILEEREVPFIPFFDFCPDPIPHRFFGQSLIDKSYDTQRINTTLQRQMLDNMYLANLPQKIVDENRVNENTYADLLNPRIGSIIRAEDIDAVREIVTSDRSASALQAIQYFKQVRGEDTGVTRSPIAMSAEALDPEKTATEIRDSRDQANTRRRLMARIFAERFMKPLCEAILQMSIMYQEKERIVKLRGEWVPVNPQYWNSNLRACVRAGLGYENTEQNVATGQLVLALQEKAIPSGLSSPALMYRTVEKMLDSTNFGHVEEFFVPPDQAKPPPPKPDPAVQIAQMENQRKMQEAQMAHQRDVAKMQMEAQLKYLQIQLDTVTDRQDDQLDFQAEMAKIQAQFNERMEQISQEAIVADVRTEVETALEVRQQNLNFLEGMASNTPNLTDVDPGGSVGP